jgi:hypothetical protein
MNGWHEVGEVMASGGPLTGPGRPRTIAGMRLLAACLPLALAVLARPANGVPRAPSGEPADAIETARYLRPSERAFVPESEITVKKSRTGLSVESVTERGKSKLTVSSRYDDRERLTSAEVTLVSGDKKVAHAVSVTFAAGKATIRREGQPAQEVDVAPDAIVTSAPDWTDAFLLCRRYDRKAGGKQSFPGLWIHPEQATQLPKFAIERTGQDTIEHAGKERKLDRYTIWLRSTSTYAAWADDQGRLIKLVPFPYKEGAGNWIVLEGYEKSSSGVRPR